MHGELRDLGIPFFGVRPHSVMVDDDGPPIKSTSQPAADPRRGPFNDDPTELSTSVRATELLALQKKMLELLQDMCTA